MRNNKPLIFLVFLVLVLGFLILAFSPNKVSIPQSQLALLKSLALEAIDGQDVPVAALLLYKNEIIGEGYNTVRKNQSLNEHAEINAVNEAFKRYKNDFFS